MDYTDYNNNHLNLLLTLNYSLNNTKNTAAGPDTILIIFLKKLPTISKVLFIKYILQNLVKQYIPNNVVRSYSDNHTQIK